MTSSQVQAGDDGTVRLRLGRVPIQLPEPVASVALSVTANRKGHATIGATGPSPWLFPGGQPGRRSAAHGSPSGSRPSESAPARPAARHCSNSPPRSPRPSSPAPSASAPTSPSPGSDCPQATGPPTPPPSAAGPRSTRPTTAIHDAPRLPDSRIQAAGIQTVLISDGAVKRPARSSPPGRPGHRRHDHRGRRLIPGGQARRDRRDPYPGRRYRVGLLPDVSSSSSKPYDIRHPCSSRGRSAGHRRARA